MQKCGPTDIKPYNILFSDKNSDYGLKIIDFGLARELGPDNVVDIVKLQGTIEFMSPEVINCKVSLQFVV